MHLAQIAALPMVAEDLTEAERAGAPALDGDGFQNIFADAAKAWGADLAGSEPQASPQRLAERMFSAPFASEARVSEWLIPGRTGIAGPITDGRVTQDQVAEGPVSGAPDPEESTVEGPVAGWPVAKDPVDEFSGTAMASDLDRLSKTQFDETQIGALRAPEPHVGLALAPVDLRPALYAGTGDTQSTMTSQTPVAVTGAKTDRPTEAVSTAGPASFPSAGSAVAKSGLLPDAPLQGLATPPTRTAAVPLADSDLPGTLPGQVGAGQGLGHQSNRIRTEGAQTAIPADTGPPHRQVNGLASGSDKPVHFAATAAPNTIGGAAQDGSDRAAPQVTQPGPGIQATPHAVGMTRGPDAGLPKTHIRPLQRPSLTAPVLHPAEPTVPATARLDEAARVVAPMHTTVTGQTAPRAGGGPQALKSQSLAAEARGVWGDARSAPTAAAGAPQDVATSETPSVAAPAGTSPPGGAAMHPGIAAAGPATAPSGTSEGLFQDDPAMVDPVLGDTRGSLRSAPAATLSVLQLPDTPHRVALQIADVVRASGDRAVELKLQPEELGRVHLTMSQDATGTLTVSLNVERPETLDLLRRNIDLLGNDLRDLGYENIDFAFQGESAGSDQDGRHGRDDTAGGAETDTGSARPHAPAPATQATRTAGDGIDIRL